MADEPKAKAPAAGGDEAARFEIKKWNAVCMCVRGGPWAQTLSALLSSSLAAPSPPAPPAARTVRALQKGAAAAPSRTPSPSTLSPQHRVALALRPLAAAHSSPRSSGLHAPLCSPFFLLLALSLRAGDGCGCCGCCGCCDCRAVAVVVVVVGGAGTSLQTRAPSAATPSTSLPSSTR